MGFQLSFANRRNLNHSSREPAPQQRGGGGGGGKSKPGHAQEQGWRGRGLPPWIPSMLPLPCTSTHKSAATPGAQLCINSAHSLQRLSLDWEENKPCFVGLHSLAAASRVLFRKSSPHGERPGGQGESPEPAGEVRNSRPGLAGGWSWEATLLPQCCPGTPAAAAAAAGSLLEKIRVPPKTGCEPAPGACKGGLTVALPSLQ